MAQRRGTLMTLMMIALLVLLGAVELKRQAVQAQLSELTVRLEQLQVGGDQAKNQEAARQIVEKVRMLIDIPGDVEPTVATIVDIEALRSQNPFYSKAENGDHLIVTQDRAILYSSTRNVIIDVVPVQLDAVPPAEETAAQ